ncbi:MAG: amidohydrolase family protein [Chloroflexota bacterium]
MLDLIIRQARLLDGQIVDIGISQGKISKIAPDLAANGQTELQAEAQLTIPAFVNGQLHACKSFWRRLLPADQPTSSMQERFAAAKLVKQQYTADDVFTRVDETIRLAIQHGTCGIRLFGDVDEDSGVSAIEGLLRVKEKYAEFLTVQVVAFPQDGVLNPATQDLMRTALELGADVVGGIPWIEPNEAAQAEHVAMCFDLAKAFDRDLHFVCDDVADPTVRSLEMVARQTLTQGWQGRVCATQCAALSFYPDAYAETVINILKEAEITIFSNSHVSLIATDFDQTKHPWPRSITRVRQLLSAGVPVACGQDDIDNWFYPFGRNDMLEVAQFMAHNGQFGWAGEVNQVLPLVTDTPAQVLQLPDYGLYEGAVANVVVLAAQDWHEAIQFQGDKRFVVLRGQLVAQSKTNVEILIT